MSVLVHGAPMSAGSVSAAAMALHIGCGDLTLCDISKGQQNTPEFLAINPFHHIPSMEDKATGVKGGECGAILRYIAAKYKPELYPIAADPKKAFEIDFALEAFNGDVSGVHQQTVYVVFQFTGPKEEEEQKKACAKYAEMADLWCKTFLDKSGKFACGDELTIADFRVVPFFFCAIQPVCKAKIGLEMPERVQKYVEDFMAAAPEAAKLMTDKWGCSLKEYAAGKA